MKAISLRTLLWFDTGTCAAMGVLLAGAADPLSGLLGLPIALLWEAAVILLLFALFVAWVAARPEPSSAARLVVAANLAWTVASLALVLGSWFEPTGLGVAFILAQAAAVAVIAMLQMSATRRSTRSA